MLPRHVELVLAEAIEDNDPDCAGCGGLALKMGALGRREWFRCRDCGLEFSVNRSARGVR